MTISPELVSVPGPGVLCFSGSLLWKWILKNDLKIFRLVRMEDEGFKLQPSGKIFNGEIFKPTTTIPIFIKMNKVSGEIRTPNVIQRNNIEFLVQVSTLVT